MKATEQYFPVVLSILLYKVSLIFKPIEDILESESLTEQFFFVVQWNVVCCPSHNLCTL